MIMRFFYLLIMIMFLSSISSADMDKKISVNMKNADVKDLFNAIALASSTNIVLAKDIDGKVSVFLNDVKLIDAIKSVTSNAGLNYEIENDIIYIYNKPSTKSSDMALGDLETYFFKPQYIPLDHLEKILTNFLINSGGKIVLDNSNNSIIITDTKNNLKYIKDILTKLDIPIKQVLIEAKIVELSKNGSKNLGIQWGATYNAANTSVNFPGTIGISGGQSSANLSAPISPNYMINMPLATGVTPAGGIGLLLGNRSGNFLLDVKLQALEQSGEAKLVSEPKIVTLNNQKAKIESGEEIRYKVATNNASGTTTDNIEKDEAKLILEITPQIGENNDILLNIVVEKSEFDTSRNVDGYPFKLTRKAQTLVLVKDGETTIIGGLKKEKLAKTETSVPGLSKIPLLGALFRSKGDSSEVNDLVIFITPKIIGDKKVKN